MRGALVCVSKGYVLRIPRGIAEAAGIREASLVKLRVEGTRIIIEPAPGPFDVALTGPKFARTTFEELEEEAEEMLEEMLG